MSIDHFIVYVFLFMTFLLGLWAGRGVRDIREYALANRMYGTGVLTITFLATLIGGSTIMGVSANAFNDGIIAELSCIAPIFCMVWMALWIAPKMVHFEGCLTMGDLMGTLYGTYGQIITGIVGAFFSICVVSAQVLSLGYVYEFILGFKSRWAIAVGGLIAVLYSAKGGMKSVTITDVFQFIVLVIVVPMIAHAVVLEVGGVKELFARVPAKHLQIIGHEKLGYYTSIVLSTCVLSPALLSPPIVSRMLMARDKRQVVDMLLIGGAFLLPFCFLIMLIGLGALVLYPTIVPSEILPHVIGEFFPEGLRGICAAGLIAVIMSTADSFLHTAGLSLSHDVLRHFFLDRHLPFNALKWSQYGTLLVGCLAIALALGIHDVFPIVVFGTGLMSASIILPFVAGVLGLKTDFKSFFIALLISLPTYCVSHLFLNATLHHWVYPFNLLVNAVIFFGCHYWKNQGFVVVKREAIGSTSRVWQPQWRDFFKWLSTPRQWLRYSSSKIAKYGSDPVVFALFITFNYMVPFFMHVPVDLALYPWLMGVKSLGAMLCVGLLLKPYWPPSLSFYFPSYYHLSLLYCLPFTTTLLLLLRGYTIEWVVNVALSIMLLIVLVDWITFMLLAVLGVALGFVVHSLLLGAPVLSLDSDTLYTLLYASIFATLIGLIFVRRREQRMDRQQKELQGRDLASQASLLQAGSEKFQVLQALQSTGVQDLLKVARALQGLYVEKRSLTRLHAITSTLIPIAFQLQGIDTRAQHYLRLQVASVSFKQLVATIQEGLRDQGLGPIRVVQHTQHTVITCDPVRLAAIITQSVALLRQQLQSSHREAEQTVLLGVEDTLLRYPLPDVEADYVKQVDALCIIVTTEDDLPTIEASYFADLTTVSAPPTKTTQEHIVREHQRVIKAHYGYMQLDISTLRYVVPMNLKEVRPQDLDKSYMALGTMPVRADDRYKDDNIDAQVQEGRFLAIVGSRTAADLGLIKTALELIKWYHGPVQRNSGEPFYLHPLAVAQIVLDYDTSQSTILGALLHDTVEDTTILVQHIEAIFGEEVAKIVDVVTHLQSVRNSIYKIKLSTKENFRMLNKTSNNTRGLYVKLADRMHNMRTIQAQPYACQVRMAKETCQFFVPLAQRLGLHKASKELEDMSMAVLMQGIKVTR